MHFAHNFTWNHLAELNCVRNACPDHLKENFEGFSIDW
jgi:hypothetical protein